MVRGASKNFERVTVVPSPKYYPLVVEELKRTGGGTTLEFRRRLAIEAFSLTSSYDASIFNALRRIALDGFPERFLVSGSKFVDAKYGENPDTKAAIYTIDGCTTMAGWEQLAGDAMSFNNYLDVGSAYCIVEGYEDVAAVAVVKHGQISGWNEGEKDGSVYTEIVAAPAFADEALSLLAAKQKKKIRVIMTGAKPDFPYDIKVVEGAMLVQRTVDFGLKLDASGITVPTRKKPAGDGLLKLLAAWEVVRKVQSNGIVIANGDVEGGRVKRFWTLGVASFRKRNGAVKIALENAGDRAEGAVCASDGFFPFRDSIDLLAEAGVSSVIQPGGSARDSEVVRAADEHGMTM